MLILLLSRVPVEFSKTLQSNIITIVVGSLQFFMLKISKIKSVNIMHSRTLTKAKY